MFHQCRDKYELNSKFKAVSHRRQLMDVVCPRCIHPIMRWDFFRVPFWHTGRSYHRIDAYEEIICQQHSRRCARCVTWVHHHSWLSAWLIGFVVSVVSELSACVDMQQNDLKHGCICCTVAQSRGFCPYAAQNLKHKFYELIWGRMAPTNPITLVRYSTLNHVIPRWNVLQRK